MIEVNGSLKLCKPYLGLLSLLQKVPGLGVTTEKVSGEELHYSVRARDVVNSEFGATIENWIADFVSSEDWIGYDQFYRQEDYRRIVRAMRVLDPHYTEFKNSLKLDNYPDGIMIFADMGVERGEDRLAVGTYGLKISISPSRTLENPITVHLIGVRKKYRATGLRGEYRSERQITLTFLHELAHHLQQSKGLSMSNDEDEMVRTWQELMPSSYLPRLFEELVRDRATKLERSAGLLKSGDFSVGSEGG